MATNVESAQSVMIDGFSGALGGVVAQLIFYPLENFRTRMQAKQDGGQISGTYKTLLLLAKNDGWLSFYKGLKMAVIATIASSGSYFFLYNLLKGLIITLLKGKKLTKRHIALVTAIAGASSSVFANPFWFMNTRMTLAKKEAGVGKQTISGLICKILNEEGFQALYAGVLPNMILVLNPIINFVVYETVNDWYRKSHQQRRMSTQQIFVASSLGKLLATLCTYPILTCRVRMQAKEESQTDSRIAALLKLLGSMSWSEYYRGMQAKILQTILYNAFLMLTYEKMRSLIKVIFLSK